MKSILEDLTIIQGLNRRFSPVMNSSVIQTEMSHSHKYTLLNEYILQAVIGIQFWSTPIQFQKSLRQAKVLLANRLYGDIDMMVGELKMEIMNGNNTKAIEICDMISNYTKASQ